MTVAPVRRGAYAPSLVENHHHHSGAKHLMWIKPRQSKREKSAPVRASRRLD